MSVLYTHLAAGVPQRHGVVVGGVCPGACWIDAAQLLHIMADEGISCGAQNETKDQRNQEASRRVGHFVNCRNYTQNMMDNLCHA